MCVTGCATGCMSLCVPCVFAICVLCVCVHIKISLNVATAAGAIVCACVESSLCFSHPVVNVVVAVDSCLQAVGTTLTQPH